MISDRLRDAMKNIDSGVTMPQQGMKIERIYVIGRRYWYKWASQCEAVQGELIGKTFDGRYLIRSAYSPLECRIVQHDAIIAEVSDPPPAKPSWLARLWSRNS